MCRVYKHAHDIKYRAQVLRSYICVADTFLEKFKLVTALQRLQTIVVFISYVSIDHCCLHDIPTQRQHTCISCLHVGCRCHWRSFDLSTVLYICRSGCARRVGASVTAVSVVVTLARRRPASWSTWLASTATLMWTPTFTGQISCADNSLTLLTEWQEEPPTCETLSDEVLRWSNVQLWFTYGQLIHWMSLICSYYTTKYAKLPINCDASTETGEPTTYQRPMTVFWSRSHRQHHATTCLMKLADGERMSQFLGNFAHLVVWYEHTIEFSPTWWTSTNMIH